MAKISLSQNVYESLVRHLAEAGENKSKLFDQYFPGPSKERSHFEDLYDEYIRRVESLLKNADRSQAAKCELPFVTIGSRVNVRDLTDQEVISYRIVSPYRIDIGNGDVSCLSPVGKSLMLRKVGDEVTVNAPGGSFSYKVLSIQYSDSIQ